MTAMPWAVSSRMMRNRLPTSSWASTALGSSMMMSLASWDSARAMLTTCLPADGRRAPAAGPGSRGWPSRRGSPRVRRAPRPRRHEPEPLRLVAEEDVLRHDEVVDEVELLVDGGDAGLHRGLRVGERDRLAEPLTSPASGWCTPESTLMSVDLPAPFWPSRQCTSPARTSSSTPSSARTPGERLDHVGEPQHGSPTRAAPPSVLMTPRSKAISLASTAAPATPARGPSSDSTTGRLPGGQRQRAPVDHAADLGQQDVAEPGQPAADDDHRRVDEADQAGEHAADAPPAVADELDAGGVALGRAVGDVLRGDRAVGREPLGERGRRRRTAAAASASRASAAPPKSASRQPTLPQAQTGPCASTWMCPMSPAHPSGPR